jgi:hypothetical protein
MNMIPLRPSSTVVLGTLLVAALSFGASGCAVSPVSDEPMAVAESAVTRATTTSTRADAADELRVASTKLASARDAVARKDYVRATQLAEQAEIDARVAELRAQSERSRRAAQESQDAARALSEELARKTTG